MYAVLILLIKQKGDFEHGNIQSSQIWNPPRNTFKSELILNLGSAQPDHQFFDATVNSLAMVNRFINYMKFSQLNEAPNCASFHFQNLQCLSQCGPLEEYHREGVLARRHVQGFVPCIFSSPINTNLSALHSTMLT
ncbi:hypothetical protein AA313_de0207527 [Arthrobotrys entomopaga]|nr:hypothetical protein AA313_de0207527 [Arthrobotrys entomopaga]